MKKALIIILIFACFNCYSQTEDSEIIKISLEIVDGKRGYSNLVIFSRARGKVTFFVKEKRNPLTDDTDYKEKKQLNDSSEEIFLQLKNSIAKIDAKALFNKFPYSLRGYFCVLKYTGSSGGSVSINFPTPNMFTEERGITSYLNTCVFILKAAGFLNSEIKSIFSLDEERYQDILIAIQKGCEN